MPRQAEVNQPVSLRKRDGRLAAFELAKIERAIAAAGAATGEFDAAVAQALAEAVLDALPRGGTAPFGPGCRGDWKACPRDRACQGSAA